MKILHLLCSNHFSGAENVVCQIVQMFKGDDGVEMVYCSPDGQIRQALKERDVTFAPIAALTVKEVKRVIKEHTPDVVHAHDMRASFLAARACGKIPLISHIHNNAFDSRGLSVKSLAYLLAAKKAKHIFWVSNSSKDGYRFQKAIAKKSSVLYNVINIKALQDKRDLDCHEYDYDVVYVGRLVYQKDPLRLVQVLERLVKKLPTVKIGVVGAGDLEEEVKTFCNQNNLQDNVHLLGFMKNPLKVLSQAKVMVMTSRWEGTPMGALESLALGTPIVSTPTDGLCELIEDGANGFLSNDDDVLAERLYELVSSAELHARMSAEAKRRAEEQNRIEPYKQALQVVYAQNLAKE